MSGGRVQSWDGWGGEGGAQAVLAHSRMEVMKGAGVRTQLQAGCCPRLGASSWARCCLGPKVKAGPCGGWAGAQCSRCSWWCAGCCSDTNVGLPRCYFSASLAVCASAVLPEVFRPRSKEAVWGSQHCSVPGSTSGEGRTGPVPLNGTGADGQKHTETQ